MVVENRKTQIIETAQRLIDSKGYGSFSYRDLEKALGLRKASIHHHFAKKEALGLAILDRVEIYLKSQFEQLTHSTLEGWDRLFLLFEPGCVRAQSEGKICTLASLLHDFGELPSQMRKRLKELTQLEVDIVKNILEDERAKGTIRFEGNPRDKALAILTTIKGAMHYSRTLGGEVLEMVKRDLKLNLVD